MNRPRIVLAMTATTAGGVSRHVQNLGAGLMGEGWDVRLAGLPGSRAVADVAERLGAKVEHLDAGFDPGDVFHLHLASTYDRKCLPLAWAARRGGAAVVLTEHLPRTNASDRGLTVQDRRTPGAALAKTALKRAQFVLADRVVAVSASSRDFLCTRYGVPARRIAVIENGVDVSASDPGAGFAARDGVVAVGSVILQKGHDVLVRAAARSRVPWTVTVLGEGAQRAEWTALAARLAPGRVLFPGWVDDPDARVARSRVSVLPSRWESFPYAVGESRMLGTPLVGSRVDGIVDQIVDGVSGALVDPEDVDATAAAIDRLMTDEDHWNRLRAGGLEHARRYSLDRMVSATAGLYSDILRVRTPQPV